MTFEPYESLSAKGAWERALPGTEDPVSVALGSTFAAVATDSNVLRIFSTGGLQQAVISLSGAPVCLAARDSTLAVAWHASSPTMKGHQHLHITVRLATPVMLLCTFIFPTIGYFQTRHVCLQKLHYHARCVARESERDVLVQYIFRELPMKTG